MFSCNFDYGQLLLSIQNCQNIPNDFNHSVRQNLESVAPPKSLIIIILFSFFFINKGSLGKILKAQHLYNHFLKYQYFCEILLWMLSSLFSNPYIKVTGCLFVSKDLANRSTDMFLFYMVVFKGPEKVYNYFVGSNSLPPPPQ